MPGDTCSQVIVAPPCKLPKLTFQYFDMYDKILNNQGLVTCYFDALLIRLDKSYKGNVYVHLLY